jgi:DNA-binding Lrp family transcriptional regulator
VRYNKRDEIQDIVYRLNLVGDIVGQLDCVGNTSASLFAIKSIAEEKIDLLLDGLSSNLVQNHPITFPSIDGQHISNTYFKIMRSLFLDARMEISDIANNTSISSKTVARRLGKLTKNKILEFSVLCDLAVMPGFVISIVSANVKEAFYRNVIEKVYSELLTDSFLLRSPFLGQKDVLIWMVCSKDTMALDSFINKLKSYTHVEKVEVFITTRLKYYKEVMIREAERKIRDTEITRRTKATADPNTKEIPKVAAKIK